MWGMPRSVRELRTGMETERLWAYLEGIARDCDCAIVIRTPEYGKGGTEKEFKILEKLRETERLRVFEVNRASDLMNLDLLGLASGTLS
jgi:hypothetical protein